MKCLLTFQTMRENKTLKSVIHYDLRNVDGVQFINTFI